MISATVVAGALGVLVPIITAFATKKDCPGWLKGTVAVAGLAGAALLGQAVATTGTFTWNTLGLAALAALAGAAGGVKTPVGSLETAVVEKTASVGLPITLPPLPTRGPSKADLKAQVAALQNPHNESAVAPPPPPAA